MLVISEKRTQSAKTALFTFLNLMILPFCLYLQYLYITLSHTKIFTTDAHEFEPVSRAMYEAVGPNLHPAVSAGCLPNLLILLLVAVVWLLHFSISLAGWIVAAIVLKCILSAFKR